MKSNSGYDENRKRVMDEAIEVVKKYGYNISMQELCRNMHMTTGNFYHYFKNKSDILLAKITEVDQLCETEFEAHMDDNHPIDEIFRFVHYYFICFNQAGFSSIPEMNSLEILNSTGFTSPCNKPAQRILSSLICSAQKKGLIESSYPSDELASMILCIILGCYWDWTRKQNSYDLVETSDTLLSIFITGLSLK